MRVPVSNSAPKAIVKPSHMLIAWFRQSGEGLRFKDGKIGTGVTCSAFSKLQEVLSTEASLASPMGIDGLQTRISRWISAT